MSEVGLTSANQDNRMNDQLLRQDSAEPEHDNPDTPIVSNVNAMIGQPHDSNPVRLKVNPRPYNGSASWREYQSHFERVSRINGWNYQLQLDYLWVNLTDSALSYADSLSPEKTASYDALCSAMEERFGDTQLAEVFKSELRSRRRQNGESLPALAQDINRLVQRAYPDMGRRGMEEFAVERFREAIPDQEQRMAVFHSRATTLDQAVRAALEIESWQVSERSRAPQRLRAVSGHDQEQGVNESCSACKTTERSNDRELEDRLMKKMEEFFNNSKTERRSSVRCYYCQNWGHIQKDCRKKKADSQKSKSQSENYPEQH